jgi:DNA-binding response OmpR family regulator
MSEVGLSPGLDEVDSPRVEPGTAKPKRILLVEGDGFTRLVLLLRLRLAGFAVDFTSNGVLGLGKLRSCHPDILLIELKLCGMSGVELIKAARVEPAFGNRPIYVFTHVDRMNRATRKEVGALATKVFDKNSTTRESLVQTFATMFLSPPILAPEQRSASPKVQRPAEARKQTVLPGAIEAIVAGVREQSELLAKGSENRAANAVELLSRVSSLASCADAAGLPNLARHAKALENFLNQLCLNRVADLPAHLVTINRAVEVMAGLSLANTGEEQTLRRFAAVLIDEEPSSNKAMQRALVDAGFEPCGFEEPARGREYLGSNRTEVIIANLPLPETHSLSLSDIRQLPLHAETPVVFGPDSTITAPLGERLPTIAARLDSDERLLTALVLRALNQLQGSGAEDLASSTLELPEASAARPPAINTAASESFEDGFELFSRSGSISRQPAFEAEPDSINSQDEGESLARLPAISNDQSQNDETPIEAPTNSDLQLEPVEPATPEPTTEDGTVAAPWLAPENFEAGQSISASEGASEPEKSDVTEAYQTTATRSNYEEDMNHQFNETSAYAPSGDDATSLPEYSAGATADQVDEPNRLSADTVAGESAENAQARCAELEQELAALRQALDDFNASFQQQQQAGLEASKYVEELEERLRLNAADQEKQKHEQQQAHAELNQQLEAASAASQQNESARQQADTRCAQLEQELDVLRQSRDDLANKLAQEQKASAESSARVKQLEDQSTSQAGNGAGSEEQIRQGVAALARTTAELARERGERQRSEQRTAELNERLQELHQDLGRTLKAQRDDLARITSLEEEQRQTRETLDRRHADVEQLQAERQLAEDELQKTKHMNAQLRKDLLFFDEINKKFGGTSQELQAQLEASLSAARENEAILARKSSEQQQLADGLETAKQELQNQSHKRETLEQELQRLQQSLQDREAKLQKESAERQRLKDALDSAQRSARGGSERDLEFSKLQSALQLEQVERKRQEAELTRMHQSALNSAHAARALRTGLRRQIREPVENLVQSASGLLELELGEAQKKLAEAVLQDVLLVQTRLREPVETAPAEPGESTAAPTQAKP